MLRFRKEATLKEFLIKRRPKMRNEAQFIHALSDVTFSVPAGSALGIVGRNGSGKSTLLRILAGVMAPDSGEVRVAGEIAPLLSLGVGFHPDLTGRENARISGLMFGLTPYEIDERLTAITEFAEMSEFIDTPVRLYSSGMYARLAFSVAIHVDPDVLLLDEIFAVGDHAFAMKCRERMAQFRLRGKTIVLVSHDSSTIESFCDTALWLDKGSIKMFGSAHDVVSAYLSWGTAHE